MRSEEDLQKWYSKSKLSLSTLLREQKVCQEFQKLPIGQDAIWRIEQSGYDKWNLRPILDKGFVMGAHFTDVEGAREPYNNWNEMIGVLANHIRSGQELLERSKM